MKKVVRVEQCDAPNCDVVYPEGGAPGFHFPTLLVVSSKEQKRYKDVYACSEAHIEPAVNAVIQRAPRVGRLPIKRDANYGKASKDKKEIT